jgi:hypothetical protein
MNSNWQFRFSNDPTTAGCLVRQHFDEPLFGRLEDRASRSLAELFRKALPGSIVWKFQNRYRQFEFTSLHHPVRRGITCRT